MNWIVLVLAGLCECGFAFCLGKANFATGSRQIIWYAVFVILYALNIVLLAKAVKTIPIGTAYPVWTGIGAVGTVLLGILVFREPATFWRLFFTFTLIALIIFAQKIPLLKNVPSVPLVPLHLWNGTRVSPPHINKKPSQGVVTGIWRV